MKLLGSITQGFRAPALQAGHPCLLFLQQLNVQMNSIIVNGRKWTINQDTISYEDLVSMAGKTLDDRIVYTVTYRQLTKHGISGSLIKGESVEIKPYMNFNVIFTGNA